MVFFFLLAGATLEIEQLSGIGPICAAYVFFRSCGRLFGGWVGGRLGGASNLHSRWLGFALLPQAGVALGMALIASDHFPSHGEIILAVTLGATVVFELFGPLLTMLALRMVGEAEVSPAMSTKIKK